MLRSAQEPSDESVAKTGRTATGKRSKATAPDRDTGSALRSIYQRTVEEDIPSEMLSLLGKLD